MSDIQLTTIAANEIVRIKGDSLRRRVCVVEVHDGVPVAYTERYQPPGMFIDGYMHGKTVPLSDLEIVPMEERGLIPRSE